MEQPLGQPALADGKSNQVTQRSSLRWILPEPCDGEASRRLAAELGVPLFIAEMLCRRGFSDAAEAARFLDPKLKDLSDPFLLPNMAAAIERLLRAIDRQERIVLYGDYDVDGVTSLALLTRILRAFGAEPQCFLPGRMDEGYGLTPDGVARCLSTLQPQLLVAVDCGTASHKEIASLRGSGVDVVVLDHHESTGAPPECVAVVNPKLGAQFRYLCSAGIAFKVAHALLKRRPLPGLDLREYLDYVALGTVADLVPLIGENRTLVRRGLAQLGVTRWPGIRALKEVAAIKAPVSAGDVGFKLAPRMNAAGRLGTAQDALNLLLAESGGEAVPLAESLEVQNRERRAVEDAVLTEAETQLAECFVQSRDAAVVVGGAGWHPGVIGIVASRIMKRYHRPTLVIGFDENGVGKGSGRSIDGLSLVETLAECSHLLERHGGHEMAAGLTVRHASFAEFRVHFSQCARRRLTDEQLQPRLKVDAELRLSDIKMPLLVQYEALQPFGMGNGRPLFFSRGVTVASEPRVMKEKHLSLTLRQGSSEIRAVWFGAAEETLPRTPWDVAFDIERNEYQGIVTPQMQIRAVRTSS